MTRTLRPFQLRGVDFMHEHPRCNIWGDMGIGKTVMVLTMLHQRYDVWGDSQPTLILGPKRVAKDVWTDEVGKWPHLAGLDIAVAVGDEAERAAALRRDVPVVAINYDNVPWLFDHLGGKWPFGTVIADEATRLKNFRARGGGVRAHWLGTVAHQRVKRWVNLTGTPAPNGLIDTWGQNWFVDDGQRLGKSFSAFESRYFSWKRRNATDRFAKDRVIHPSDVELIHDALAEVTLRIENPLGVEKPVFNVIEVDLPPSARKHYRELERELFTRFEEGGEREVFNAAQISMACLQAANGAIYLDRERYGPDQWVEIHDAKLDALDSILAEASGSPVLVAYHFKSDLARLKRTFPDLIDVATPEGLARAKRGEGRLWAGHPASMGHGVDGLQFNCHTAAFFGHWWNLEEWQQFIERIGPTRQKQAGFDRQVNVHYIVARNTVDEAVVARRLSKESVQDALLRGVKERNA